MVLVESTMLALGTKAPDFQLLDVVSNTMISLESFQNKQALLVMFLCSHCPYVKHIQTGLAQLGQDYQNTALGILAMSANDTDHYPEDNAAGLKQQAQSQGFVFPYCLDDTQEIAKAYTASCTPDFFLFDADRKLVYRGQLDDSRPGNALPVTGQDLRTAIESVLNKKPITIAQKPSIGCNIKWKPGNEPRYF